MSGSGPGRASGRPPANARPDGAAQVSRTGLARPCPRVVQDVLPMAVDLSSYPNLMNPECPWVGLREWGGLPNVKWCEETLCAVVAEPANTWSNLAFLIGAAALWRMNKDETSRTLR